MARSRSGFQISYVAAALALIVTLTAGYFVEQQNKTVHEQNVRAEVSEQLGLVRAQLEGNVYANLQLARGLVAVISSQPNMSQQQFSAIAKEMVGEHSQISNLAAAPDLVVKLMYPIDGNEKAIGLDYLENGQQRGDVLKAVLTDKTVLAGPIDLVQRGRAFIGRFPVYTNRGTADQKLWGLVSAVIDIEELFAASGFSQDDLSINVAVATLNPVTNQRSVFKGSTEVFDDNPVVAPIELPSATWHIAAVPKSGWPAGPENVWPFRLAIALGGLLLIVPMLLIGRLYDERRANYAELQQRKEQLQRLSQRLELALSTSKIGVWELNLDTGELTWDNRMKELYGLFPDEPAANYDVWSRALHPEDREKAQREFDEAINQSGTYESEFRVRLPDGSDRWIRAIGAVHKNIDNHRYIMGVNWDVSSDFELRNHLLATKENVEQRNLLLEDARAQMEHNALHDSLTGLPNRRYLDEWLSKRNPDDDLALFQLDLDRFKQINDTLGHAAGDEVICHAANVLNDHLETGSFVARTGGDEFVIAIVGQTEKKSLAALADRIIIQMRQPFMYENTQCRIGVSIGIARLKGRFARGNFAKRLLVDADIALYQAKRNGRDRFEFFSDELRTDVVRNKRMSDDVLSALEKGEFLPVFQPQFDAKSLNLVGVEALVRWEHPTDGLLAPAAFLSVAQDLDVTKLIDRTILEQSLFQRRRWQAAGIEVPKVSVNVSASRLRDSELIDQLTDLSIEPGSLAFELLESIFLDGTDEIIERNAEQLRSLGVDIVVDDFGTGYASISSLLYLTPAQLKIDRGMVMPITTSTRERQLVTAMIEIGRSLGIKVVAEGVETMEHVAILRELGCDILQGYALGKPMRSTDLMDFVRQESWRQAA